MLIEILINREIKKSGNTNLNELENKVTTLKFQYPKHLKEYNKYIEFKTSDGKVRDIIENDTYILTSAITKYTEVDAQIVFKKDIVDDILIWKSNTFKLYFTKGINAEKDIENEKEIDVANKLIDELRVEISKVEELETDILNLIADIEEKLANGDFNGNDYILTEEDKKEIADTVKPMVENEIQPTIDEIQDIAEHAEVIARGRATGYVFDTLEDLDNWLQDETNKSKLVLGDNFYIRALNVPDYWWDGETKQQLEGEKPDLTEYLKNEEVDKKELLITYEDQTTETVKLVVYK